MICELLWFHLLQQTLAQLLLNRGEGGETCLSPLNFPVTPVLIMFAFAGRVRTVHHAQTLQGWAEMRPVVLIHQLFFFLFERTVFGWSSPLQRYSNFLSHHSISSQPNNIFLSPHFNSSLQLQTAEVSTFLLGAFNTRVLSF